MSAQTPNPSVTATGPIRVLVIDDLPVEIEGIRNAVGPESDIEIIGQPQTGISSRQVDRHAADIVIADFFIRDAEPVNLFDIVAEARTAAKILVFTAVENPDHMLAMFRLGVRGYLSKRSPSAEIPRAIRALAEDRVYVDATVAGRLLPLLDPALRGRGAAPQILSEREIAVLKLVAWGLSDKEIGFKLGVSIKSVGTYKYRAITKLKLGSRADIVRYAVDMRWLLESNSPFRTMVSRVLSAKD